MKEYLDIVKSILNHGERKPNRTGTDTIALFGVQYKIDLSEGFPLITTKKVNYDAVVHELLWFLSGETHIRNLHEHTKIWDEWTGEAKNWELGNTYGYQWTRWEQYLKDRETGKFTLHHINQMQFVIDTLKKDPFSRRLVVSAWNPADFYRPEGDPKKTVQPSACHTVFMFYVTMDNGLSCHITQRSGDVMLGIPFNIASYATLTQMLAEECGFKLGEFSHYINDCHIYVNHIDGAKEQIKREPRKKPTLQIAEKPFWELTFEDFKLIGYEHHPAIKFPIAI